MYTAARPRGASRKEALLDAALEILVRSGPEAVTHRSVADEAGLPLASTTYHFTSKEHLLGEAHRLAARRDVERLEARAAGLAPDADPVDAVLALVVDPFLDGSAETRSAVVAAYTLWLQGARHHATRPIAQEWIEAYVTRIAAVLEAAGAQDARRDARLVLAALDGLLIEQVAGEHPTPLRPAMRRLVSVLVAG